MTTVATNSVVTYSTTNGIMINGNSVTSWPISISANVTVTFASFLVIDSSQYYFSIDGSGVTIDGLYNNVIVQDVVNFPGLIFPTVFNTVSATIKNIGVISRGSTTLKYNCGWVVTLGYNTPNVNMINCYSTGDMTNDYSAGIINANGGGGTIYCTNCYSTGNMNGAYSQGIKYGGIVCYATNCYSTGNMTATNCGGIMSGGGSATNCYSTGNMTATSGGIYAYNSSGNAINCHSSGSIGDSCGGIYGYGGVGNATGCYSTGTNSGGGGAGGIYAYASSGNATNCYVAGVNISGGDITGYSYTGTIKNCYSLTTYYP